MNKPNPENFRDLIESNGTGTGLGLGDMICEMGPFIDPMPPDNDSDDESENG